MTPTKQTYGEYMRSNPPIPNLTAVDWYYQQTVIEGKRNYSELLEQAKQMEKQQHEQTWNAAHQAGRFEGKGIAEENWQTFEQYYNETYNK